MSCPEGVLQWEREVSTALSVLGAPHDCEG